MHNVPLCCVKHYWKWDMKDSLIRLMCCRPAILLHTRSGRLHLKCKFTIPYKMWIIRVSRFSHLMWIIIHHHITANKAGVDEDSVTTTIHIPLHQEQWFLTLCDLRHVSTFCLSTSDLSKLHQMSPGPTGQTPQSDSLGRGRGHTHTHMKYISPFYCGINRRFFKCPQTRSHHNWWFPIEKVEVFELDFCVWFSYLYAVPYRGGVRITSVT